ncbi:MAG: zinc ribbon domain-containing protein [Clostridia bacterium]|nr:zinc ribbon domain-containing protein [Clostridia bacterium]
MYCTKCGARLEESAMVCPNCGASQSSSPSQDSIQQTVHSVPRCTCCGAINEFKPGPLFRTSDIIWLLLLLFFFGAGIVFAIFILITRGNPGKREKICKKCGSVDMFSYVY